MYSAATYTNNTDQDMTITVDTDNMQSETFNPTGSGTRASSPGAGGSGDDTGPSMWEDVAHGFAVGGSAVGNQFSFGFWDGGDARHDPSFGVSSGLAMVGAMAIPVGGEAKGAESAASLLPDFTGWVLKQIEEHLGNAGFSEKKLIEGSTSPMRTVDHADGSKVTLDMANNWAKVNGPKQWATDMSQKFPPRIGPHNQPFIP